jgi:N,N'-diacetyllegionaminate synthase
MKCFIIAEAGVNHNGSEQLALELVEIAALAGADAVKFQTFKADKLVLKGTDTADYQKEATGTSDQYDMLKNLELSGEFYRTLYLHCRKFKIEFMSTAFDEETLDFLLDIGIKRIKVPSGEITNIPFICYIASKDVPIILSTGMSTLNEIKEANDAIIATRKKLGFNKPIESVLTILHCTSNYPTHPSDVNLRAMKTIADEFEVPVGYSDHTLGISISTGAVALGALVIEKHFTKSRELSGPDHKASLEENELNELVSSIRELESALGSNVKEPTQKELPIRALVRKSVFIHKDVKQGQLIKNTDLTLMRPGNGVLPKFLDEIVGKKALKNLTKGEPIKWVDIE